MGFWEMIKGIMNTMRSREERIVAVDKTGENAKKEDEIKELQSKIELLSYDMKELIAFCELIKVEIKFWNEMFYIAAFTVIVVRILSWIF